MVISDIIERFTEADTIIMGDVSDTYIYSEFLFNFHSMDLSILGHIWCLLY